MVLGARLRAVRESQKMSQKHIAFKAGMMCCNISRVEGGYVVPSVETLEKWTKALGITMSQLFADTRKESAILPALKNHTPKLNRLAAIHLRRIEASFAHMKPREILIVSSMAQKFAKTNLREK
jgi:transcriptional regulator with XRE-family HTH domain